MPVATQPRMYLLPHHHVSHITEPENPVMLCHIHQERQHAGTGDVSSILPCEWNYRADSASGQLYGYEHHRPVMPTPTLSLHRSRQQGSGLHGSKAPASGGGRGAAAIDLLLQGLLHPVSGLLAGEHEGQHADVPHAVDHHAAEQVPAAAVRHTHDKPEAPQAQEVLLVEVVHRKDDGGGGRRGGHRHEPREGRHHKAPEDELLLDGRQNPCTRRAASLPPHQIKKKDKKNPHAPADPANPAVADCPFRPPCVLASVAGEQQRVKRCIASSTDDSSAHMIAVSPPLPAVAGSVSGNASNR